MHDSLTVDMCVGIREGCPITYLITADNQTEFSFGGRCHYAFDVAALRGFLRLCAEALAEIERQSGKAQSDDRATLALVTGGGDPA